VTVLGRFTLNGATAARASGQAPEVKEKSSTPVAVSPLPELQEDASQRAFQRKILDAKVRLHRRLIDEINLPAIEKASEAELREMVRKLLSEYVLSERLPVNGDEFARLLDELLDEMTGLGPIEPLLQDPTITDILINTHQHVYIERAGQLEKVPVLFRDEAHVLRIVNRIVSAVGRRVDESQPMMDARLSDGSRVHVVIRPVAVDGPLVSIRKFARLTFSLDHLVQLGALRQPVATLLAAAVKARLSMIVSGGTGSGKTTLLNALSNHISHRERLITIEDAAELQLQQPHVGRLETRPPNIEGSGEIRQRELVRNALRMRPDRIIVGEVRGEEAFDMLQAMNTGHEGSLTTVHANSPRDAMARLEQMVSMAGMRLSQSSVRAQIASAIRLVVQLQRLSDGTRRVVSVSEIVGMEGDVIQMQNIYEFVRLTTEADGMVRGEFRATGVRPKFLDQLKLVGVNITADAFDPTRPL
jgi:pilus assembly protein CpaF